MWAVYRNNMEIMEKSPLLYTVLFYSLCLTVSTQSDTKNDIQELARRLSLLEDKVVREQYRDHIQTYQSMWYGFIGRKEKTIRDLQHRVQKLENKIIQYEKHFGKTKHCENRIQSLENIVQELATLVRKQTHYTKYIKRLETMLSDKENTSSELREQKHQKKNPAILPIGENDIKRDKNTKNEEISVVNDNKTSDIHHIPSKKLRTWFSIVQI